MKKIKLYTITIVSCLLVLMGCENNFDPKIYGKLTTTNFPQTVEDYENYLMDCYVPFGLHWTYRFSGGSSTYSQCSWYIPEAHISRYFDTPSDIFAPTVLSLSSNAAMLGISRCDFTLIENTSRHGYNGGLNSFDKIREITRMTQIIKDLEDAPEDILSNTQKEQFVAEARLLRGLMMYYLLNIYGPVPVLLDPSLISNTKAEAVLVRPSLETFAQYVTEDLEYACLYMAEVQNEKGRYTADYARFCLMRHYLNEGYYINGYYQKAYNLFNDFTGNYELYRSGSNPYADQFKIDNKFNSEVIMSVSTGVNASGSASVGYFNCLSYYIYPTTATKIDDQGNDTPFAMQSGSWGFYYPVSKTFYDSFEVNDKRKETILTSYYDKNYGWVDESGIGNQWDGFIPFKFPIETTDQYQKTDIPLARWAEVLLLYAEADVRANNTVSTSAINCVNQVRDRAGLQPLTTDKTSSVSAFLDAILVERGHELYFEGTRKIDLIRFGKYYSTMSALGRTPSSQYFPVPYYAIESAEGDGHTLAQYFTRDNYDGPQK